MPAIRQSVAIGWLAPFGPPFVTFCDGDGAIHLSANASNSVRALPIGGCTFCHAMGAIHLLPIINLSADPQENASNSCDHCMAGTFCVVTIGAIQLCSIIQLSSDHRRMPAILTERSHWMAGTFCVIKCHDGCHPPFCRFKENAAIPTERSHWMAGTFCDAGECQQFRRWPMGGWHLLSRHDAKKNASNYGRA